ncbi:hypothetical protein HFO65_15695 [Rhizobium laguerreae]|uniref:hypothetical protein n=1 Tax=Rhizobium laguerreae TaxID=1076926 RepID=UPI001C915712|nr:hypothetical protein [Rhizobium laguerreae]MBY3162077.1 hypothetical protein [Rhizobium laguerreae]
MGQFMDMLTAKPKGLRVEPKYLPEVGTRCLVSGPNCDDDNGYVWSETTVLWINHIFVLYGSEGYWPNLEKLEHVLFKPLPVEGIEGGAA